MTLAIAIAALVFALLAFAGVAVPLVIVGRRIRRLRRIRA
jgi:hypothetical protein